MNLIDITNIRISNQQLTGTKFKTAKEIVGWMGAVQAQDYAMAKWAVGIRLPNSTDQLVQSAIDKGEIIRTHVLRPTWHLVSAEDVYYMLELTGPRIKAFAKSHIKQLELTEAIFSKSNRIIEKELAGGNHLTREELMAKLNNAHINTSDLRNLHLLMRAELEGIICSGITRGKNQTYALLAERVPKPRSLNADEALARLAKTYFLSHGPATVPDFSWWAGLTITEARHAFEMVKSDFVSETIGGQTYWMSNSIILPKASQKSTYLLPAFDEYLISYKDRTAAIILEQQSKAFTINGIFNPVIVENGRVIGTWKREIKKDKVIISIASFKLQSQAAKDRIAKAAKPFGRFLGKKVEIIQTSIFPTVVNLQQ